VHLDQVKTRLFGPEAEAPKGPEIPKRPEKPENPETSEGEGKQ